MAEHFFGGYSNVALHFLFKKLFHQITPYLILGGGGTICDEAVVAAVVAQNTILRLDRAFGQTNKQTAKTFIELLMSTILLL